MANLGLIVFDCPRCGAALITGAVCGVHAAEVDYGRDFAVWEILVACRSCRKSSLHRVKGPTDYQFLSDVDIRPKFGLLGVVNVVPKAKSCPGHVPAPIQAIFNEAAACLALGFYNAAGAMFRKVLDATTRDLLPAPVEKGNPNYIGEKARRDLGLRLPELFRRGLIPLRLEEISGCIKEDGNDATHAQEGISQADAEDMQDFTILMLEERYTLPGQIAQNKQRRNERREPKAD